MRPPTRLGILGGGQLARMMVPPAHRLDLEVAVLDPDPECPAARAGATSFPGSWGDPAVLSRFAAGVDRITLDHEFVEAHLLRTLVPGTVLPSAETLARIQDKFEQKRLLAEAGLPVASFRAVAGPDEVRAAGEDLGWPLVLKVRRRGYDGKGNRRVDGPEGAQAAWDDLGDPPGGMYVEAFVPFSKELAVLAVRGGDGAEALYPVVETVQEHHICREVLFPAGVPPEAEGAVREVAFRAARAVDCVGILGVELFWRGGEDVLVNELAPRPHNSGHYSLDACVTSQFENHVRAVMGLPLGDPSPRVPAAVMVNLLADGAGPGRPEGVAEALAVPGAALHLYGKERAFPGRKMGHVTATGAERDEVSGRARRAAAALTWRRREAGP